MNSGMGQPRVERQLMEMLVPICTTGAGSIQTCPEHLMFATPVPTPARSGQLLVGVPQEEMMHVGCTTPHGWLLCWDVSSSVAGACCGGPPAPLLPPQDEHKPPCLQQRPSDSSPQIGNS